MPKKKLSTNYGNKWQELSTSAQKSESKHKTSTAQLTKQSPHLPKTCTTTDSTKKPHKSKIKKKSKSGIEKEVIPTPTMPTKDNPGTSVRATATKSTGSVQQLKVLTEKTLIRTLNRIKPKTKSPAIACCTNPGKHATKLRKRSTIWTKFPADEVAVNVPKVRATKVQTTKSSSVYRPGTSYSDVLFSSGPSCSVKIKSLASDSLLDTKLMGPQNPALEPHYKVSRKTDVVKSEFLAKSTIIAGSPNFKSIDQLKPYVANFLKTKDSLMSLAPKTSLDDFNINLDNSLETEGKSELLEREAHLNLLSDKSNEKIKLDPIYLTEGKSSSDEQESEISESSKSEYDDSIEEPTLSNNYDDQCKNIDFSNDSVLQSLICACKSTFVSLLGKEPQAKSKSIPCETCDQMNYLTSNVQRVLEKSKTTNTNNLLKVDIPLWNFLEPDAGPEIFPRYTKQFNDESYLMAEDMANLGFKLSRGNG